MTIKIINKKKIKNKIFSKRLWGISIIFFTIIYIGIIKVFYNLAFNFIEQGIILGGYVFYCIFATLMYLK